MECFDRAFLWVFRPPEGGDDLFLSNLRIARLKIVCVIAVALFLFFGNIVTAETGGFAVGVTIIADGQRWAYTSTQSTVGAILNEAGVTLNKLDRCNHKLNVKAVEGMLIRVTRIEEKTVIQKKPVEFKTVEKYDARHRGASAVLHEGVPGEKEVKVLVYYKDGVKTSSRVVEVKVTKEPKDRIVVSSQRPTLASRGGTRVRTLRMSATAYDPGPRSCGPRCTGRTANGMRAQKGVVAVDPRVIPLGTKLYVEGYGYCIAADTGGAIKGNKIDLCFNTYAEAIRFGRKTVTVHILK